MSLAQRWKFAALLLGFLLLTGCVNERESGDAKIYTIQMWVPLLILIGGIVAVPAGWLLRETSQRLGWGLLILGPIAALGFAPSLFMDKTVVTPNEITVNTGIWGMTAHHNVKYDNLQQVRITSETTRGRRGSKNTSYYLTCDCKDGSNCKLPLGNSCVEKAAVPFLTHCKAREIAVIDETGQFSN